MELADGVDCFDFLNRLRIVLMATHLGDTRSLALPAAHTIYYEMGAERRQQMGIADSLIRVSVGIEDEATCCLTSIRRSTAACKDNFGHSRGAACSARGACPRKHCRNQGQTMLIQIADAFTPEEAAEIRRRLDAAEWVDGKVTAGYQSAEVKRNRQLPEQHPLAQELGNLILQRLSANNLFMSAALPRKIFPPLFNRYEGGEAFGYHVDNAVRALSGGSERVRTDLSATLFFRARFLRRRRAGDRRHLWPARGQAAGRTHGAISRHQSSQSESVTRGARVSSFFWMQSLVREDSQRALLLDMDVAIQRLNQDAAGHPSIVQLTGIYHNLLRRWVDV